MATSVRREPTRVFPPEVMGWKLWRLDNWPEQKRIRAQEGKRAIRELESSAEWSCDKMIQQDCRQSKEEDKTMIILYRYID